MEDTPKQNNITRDPAAGWQLVEAEKQNGVTSTVEATTDTLITFFLGSKMTVEMSTRFHFKLQVYF